MKWNKKEGGRESGRLSAPLFTGKARVPYSERGMVAYVSFCLVFSSRIQGSRPMGAQNGLKGEIERSSIADYLVLPILFHLDPTIWYGPWMSVRKLCWSATLGRIASVAVQHTRCGYEWQSPIAGPRGTGTQRSYT